MGFSIFDFRGYVAETTQSPQKAGGRCEAQGGAERNPGKGRLLQSLSPQSGRHESGVFFHNKAFPMEQSCEIHAARLRRALMVGSLFPQGSAALHPGLNTCRPAQRGSGGTTKNRRFRQHAPEVRTLNRRPFALRISPLGLVTLPFESRTCQFVHRKLPLALSF